MAMLECKVDMLEHLIKEMELRWIDLNVTLRNQSTMMLEMVNRINALERGAISGFASYPQYCFYPRGYYTR